MTGEPPNGSTELALITQIDFESSPCLEDLNVALVIVTRFEGNVRYVRRVCSAGIHKQAFEPISPMAQTMPRNIRRHFAGKALPTKWATRREKDDGQYYDRMSGLSTSGEARWCVD